MAPLIVLVGSLLILGFLGLLVPALADWATDARYALAAMLLLTASAHFVPPSRQDLIRIIPSRLPPRAQLVTLTGVLEVAAAAGLALPAIAPLAGAGLALLLIAMFPASIKGAVERLPLRGKPTTPLLFRLPLQILFIAPTWWASEPTRPLLGA